MRFEELFKIRCETVSLPFGPKGCPEARLELLDMWELPGVIQRELEVLGGTVETELLDGTPIGLENHMASTRQGLNLADLYWVSPEMCELLYTAEPSVPTDVSLLQELLPSLSGLVFLATKRVGCQDTVTPENGAVRIDAFSWDAGYVVRTKIPHAELQIQSYVYHGLSTTEGAATKWAPIGQSSWPLHTRLDEFHETSNIFEMESELEDRRLLISFLALIKSPGITDTVVERPDRAASRRLERRKAPDNNTVRVIYLRSPRSNSDSSEEGDRYHHRWIVSGHWRSQPYGPKSVYRKPVWIAPHVKGPDGAPMLHGEKVRAVVR